MEAENKLNAKITESLGVLSTNKTGWALEVNMVSWFDRAPKLDIRDWSEDHTRCGKGIKLTNDEAERLRIVLEQKYGGKS